MEKYKQKELRELVRLGVAEDYTNGAVRQVHQADYGARFCLA